jgi:hypothetical protein
MPIVPKHTVENSVLPTFSECVAFSAALMLFQAAKALRSTESQRFHCRPYPFGPVASAVAAPAGPGNRQNVSGSIQGVTFTAID